MADRMASPGRPHAVEVAVEVDFEQCGRLVRGSPQFAGLGLEAQFAQVEAVAEGIYDAHHVVRGDHLFERGGEKAVLEAGMAGFARHGHRWRGLLAAASKIARFSIRTMDGQTFFTI